jgi:hypothetical protein
MNEFLILYTYNLPPVAVCLGLCLGIFIISRVEQAARKSVTFMKGIIS